MQNLTDLETGCYGLIDNCRALAAVGDPGSLGTNQTVNQACAQAAGLCFFELQGAYQVLSDVSFNSTVHLDAEPKSSPPTQSAEDVVGPYALQN